MHGQLQLQTLEQAWRQVQEQHAILRTAFAWDGKQRYVQVVQRRAPVSLLVVDGRGVSKPVLLQHLERLKRQERERGFALEQAPLMRVLLVRFAEQEYGMVWSYHHLLLDGWSVPLVFQDLLQSYQALREGHHPPRGSR